MSDGFDPLEVAAVRRVLWQLADDDPDEDDTLMDAADAVVDRVESLEDRLADLEQTVDPDPGSVAYEQLTRPQKVHRLRVALYEQATDGTGQTMHYDDVKWLFDGHPSADHCYTLMELAGEADGYHYETGGHGDGQKRIRVEPDDANDDRIVRAANNGETDTPA